MRQFFTGKKFRGKSFRRVLFFALLALIIFLFANQIAVAQQITVTGLVVGAEDAQPLIGVSVVEKDTANGTVTDVDGKFNITVAPDAVLVFTYVGFEKQEVSVQGRTLLDVTLSPGSALLQDVVVTGYRKEIR